MKLNTKYWIKKLDLKEHPEGGFFREVYRSNDKFEGKSISKRFKYESRNYFTVIYYLLEKDNFSAIHKLQSDEIWHFIDGSSLSIYILGDKIDKRILGKGKKESIYTVVPKLNWFGASINDKDSFSLVTCTIVPGFEYSDFELGKRENLLKRYPKHSEIINKLTK